MKILIAAGLSALALSGAGMNLPAAGRAFANPASPALAVCIAGMEIGMGGERMLHLTMSHTGQCGCPAACSSVMLRLGGAVALRL